MENYFIRIGAQILFHLTHVLGMTRGATVVVVVCSCAKLGAMASISKMKSFIRYFTFLLFHLKIFL
jgi:hypothetical protein